MSHNNSIKHFDSGEVDIKNENQNFNANENDYLNN